MGLPADELNVPFLVVVDRNLQDDDFVENGVNVDIPLKNTKIVREKSNKCNQCDFASSQAGDLKRHLTTHSGEKSNKCNQCDYVSSQAGDLRKHLKTHKKQMQPM